VALGGKAGSPERKFTYGRGQVFIIKMGHPLQGRSTARGGVAKKSGALRGGGGKILADPKGRC